MTLQKRKQILRRIYIPIYVFSSWLLYTWINFRKRGDEMIQESYRRLLPEPWVEESPWTTLLLTDQSPQGKCRYWKPDIWHTVHLGIGKDFVASGLVLTLPLMEGTNMEQRFEHMSHLYTLYCKCNKKVRYIGKIDKDTLGGSGKNDEPSGSWNKASVTVNLLQFLQHLSEKYKHGFQTNARLKFVDSWLHLWQLFIYFFSPLKLEHLARLGIHTEKHDNDMWIIYVCG